MGTLGYAAGHGPPSFTFLSAVACLQPFRAHSRWQTSALAAAAKPASTVPALHIASSVTDGRKLQAKQDLYYDVNACDITSADEATCTGIPACCDITTCTANDNATGGTCPGGTLLGVVKPIYKLFIPHKLRIGLGSTGQRVHSKVQAAITMRVMRRIHPAV